MGIQFPPVEAPQLQSATAGGAETTSVDERWSAWRAKGTLHDRAVRRKLMIAVPILAIAALIFYMVIGR